MRPLGLRVWVLAALASLALHAVIVAIPLRPRLPPSQTFDEASTGGSGADTSSIPSTAARADESAIDASAAAGSLPLAPIDAQRGPRAKSLPAPKPKRAASTSTPDAKPVVGSSARTRAQNRAGTQPSENPQAPPSSPLQARAPQKDPTAEKPQARSGAVSSGAPTQEFGSGGLSAAGPGVTAGAAASADGKGVSDDSDLSLESTGEGDAGKAEVGELGKGGSEGDTVSPLPTGRAAQSPAHAMPYYPAPAARYRPAPVYAPPRPAYYYPPPVYYAPVPGYYAGPPIYSWLRRHKHEEEDD